MTGYEILAVGIAIIAAAIALLSVKWSSDDRKEAIKLNTAANTKMDKANVLTTEANLWLTEANRIQAEQLAIRKDQRSDEENTQIDRMIDDRIAIEAAKIAAISVTQDLVNERIYIKNDGPHDAADLLWILSKHSGKEALFGDDTGRVPLLVSGNTWSINAAAGMDVRHAEIKLYWTDGRGIREVPRTELNEGNAVRMIDIGIGEDLTPIDPDARLDDEITDREQD